MRVLMIVQLVDEREWLRGFIVGWIRALAARVERLDVLTLERGEADLPGNVFVQSMGKEKGYGRARELIEFYRGLARAIRDVDAVIAHMTPRYAWLAAPLVRAFGKPLMLWYTHRQVTPELRLAHMLATHILTASPSSFPLDSRKVHVMGHGIETALFPYAETESHPPTVLHVARLARIKGQDRLLRALGRVAERDTVGPFRVQFVGGPVEAEPGYPADLETLARGFDAAHPVAFTGPLDRPALAEAVAQSAIGVNLSPPGLFDKAALESMLVGKPTLVTNTDFLPVLGAAADLLYLPYDSGDEMLADRLAALLALSPAERAAMGRKLRDNVIAQHSLDSLMDRIVAVISEAAR